MLPSATKVSTENNQIEANLFSESSSPGDGIEIFFQLHCSALPPQPSSVK